MRCLTLLLRLIQYTPYRLKVGISAVCVLQRGSGRTEEGLGFCAEVGGPWQEWEVVGLDERSQRRTWSGEECAKRATTVIAFGGEGGNMQCLLPHVFCCFLYRWLLA